MNSPFKFLDAYGEADKQIFFGRDADIDALYKLVFQTRLLLVYGQSGTGKTSLIQCGLANCFKPTDWFPVFVRRKEDINLSLDREIRRLAPTPIRAGASLVKAMQSLYLDHLRPIYLIFDQFEELFILGSAAEQTAFIDNIKALLASDINCRIIISMREEYIAMLYDFEKAVPTLFDKRFRVEQMKMRDVEAVITGSAAAFGIELEHGAATAQRMIANLSDRRAGVQLSYLQVYLDKLYRSAVAGGAGPVVFTDALVAETGALGDVMADFLDEQASVIQAELRAANRDVAPDAARTILEALTTLDGTKLPMTRGELGERLPAQAPVLDQALKAFEDRRILRNADGQYELAHDTLAGHIAERRSGERKNLMKLEKLIKDRLAAFEQTRTMLNREELAVVRPHLAQLGLSAEEAGFVGKSAGQVRKRRLWVVAGTASVMAVLAGFGLFAFEGQQRAAKALVLASDTTNDLSFTIFDELAKIEGTRDIRRGLLDKVREVDRELERGGAPANSSAPFWRDVLEGDIAVETWRENPTDAVFSAAEARFRQALALAKRMAIAFPADPDWQRNQSVALGRLGLLLAMGDKTEAALPALAAAVVIDEALQKARPAAFDTNLDLSGSLADLGAAEEQDGAFGDAAGHYARSLAILRQLAARDPKNLDVRYALATGAMRLGALELERKGFAPAGALYAEAAGLLDRLTRQEPKNLGWQAELATAWKGLARTGLLQDKWAEARGASDRALQVGEKLARLDSDNFERQNLVSQLHWQRAEIEKQAGDMVAARVSAQKSLAAALLLDDADPENGDWQETLALSYRQLADVETGQCKFDAARVASVESLKIARELFADSKGEDQITAYNLYAAHKKRAEIESHDRSFKAAAAATAEALRIAMQLAVDRPEDTQLAEDVRQLRATQRNLDARVALPLPKGCLPGEPG